ncbi:hypothetical protein AVEN_203449-1 [Araneus ventricosus]|uniref:Uncharacterized protein n=1 Tax=Araneus ventricosus TaxID=182803 RepID=A0A4Y2BH59_ARAVE|nr:hypothetical protein AVEN_203449-1 [Araneus ventricosus]
MKTYFTTFRKPFPQIITATPSNTPAKLTFSLNRNKSIPVPQTRKRKLFRKKAKVETALAFKHVVIPFAKNTEKKYPFIGEDAFHLNSHLLRSPSNAEESPPHRLRGKKSIEYFPSPPK